jgi:hypothetical protein
MFSLHSFGNTQKYVAPPGAYDLDPAQMVEHFRPKNLLAEQSFVARSLMSGVD